MAKHIILWLTTAAVFLATSTSAVPVIDDGYQSDEPRAVTQCAVTCPDTSNAKFQYNAGQTYEYTYESDIKTTVAGASEHSSLHMRATVLLDVISTCELTLRLIDVSLQDSEPTRYENRQHVRDLTPFKKALQDKAMSFAFIDGRVESVCPRSDDDIWAVNIRRGILSTLQNTMSRLQGMSQDRETDIAGNCPVKYEVIASSPQIIKIKKTKELLGCTNRQNTETIFQGMPYSTESDIQSMPLIASTYSCEQEVNTRSRIITKSSCVETHAFRPFAKWNSGATTNVAYKLTFRRQSNTNTRPDGARRFRSTMLYDHTMTSQQAAETLRETQQTFQTLCQKTQVDIRPDVPGLFTKLVHQMKRLDTQTLRQLMTTVKGTSMCSKAEKFYRDALPVLGTTASVSTMRQLIRDNQATEKEIDVWMSAIAFIKSPTKEMLKELKPLLESNMQKAALPVSSLINTYCQLNDNERSNPDVAQIIKMFEDVLSYNCRAQTDEQTARMLTALRAIGNAGLGAQSAVATLTRCASNDQSPMSVRVAAINAFRRIECKTNNRNELFKLLENRQADSELRINAYIATMQCASEETLQRVQTVLESDEINQVLSFIWTHLTNLRETASPLKRQIRAILENAELKKEFDMDKRKFSRNIELSTFSELLNVGATVESNLIWSGQSFVPRSASVNLTVDLFGKSINLVEVGGRIQGVEDILERLLGPGSELDNAIKRERRAPIRDELLNSIDRTFNKQPDSDQLSYFIRVFGNEIRAGDIFAFDLESFKSKFNFLDWLMELAKDHNIDVTKSFHFLDANFVVPTGSGFPLRLNAEGSATIGLSANGKVDVRQMLSSPSTFDINGSVKPSAALEIRASMGVDAQFASTGLKLVNTLHSSTVLDGVVQLRDGRVFNLDWNIPQDKVEIFNAESHVYVVYRDQDREQRTPEGQSFEWKRCTSRDVADKTGLEMCGELTVPKVGAGALGAAVARIYINKLDTYKGFHFDTSYVKSTTDDSDTVRVSFNTPGSRVDRELTTIFTLKRAQRQFNMNIKSPWKRINVDGSLIDSPALKKASLKALLDETTEYSISAELGIAVNDKQETRYTPKLKIVVPEKPNILLDGFINITPKKYDVKLALKNAFQDPVTADGWIQIVDKRASVKYDVSMQIGAPFFKGNLTGYTSQTIENSLKTWASRAALQYTYRGGSREQIVVNHKIRDQSVNSLKTYSTDCSWTSTLWPRYNGQAGVEVSYSANSVRTKVEVGLDEMRKLTIITSGAHDFFGRDKKFNGLVKFMLPYKDWNYEVKVDHINNWESLQTNATIKSGAPGPRQQMATVDLGLRKEGDHPLSVYGEAHIKFPGREISVTESLVERAPREYRNVAVIQWQRGADVRIESIYKMQPRHEMTHNIRATGLEQPITISGHVLPNPKNAQGRVELVYAGKTYMADGSWSFRGALNQFNARVSGEVSIAGRGASVTGEATRRDQEFGGNMEVVLDGNRSRRYAVSSQVTAILAAPRFQTRVEWPGQNFFELTGNGKYEQQGWHTTPRDLEGSLKLTSSVEPVREVGISFIHDKNPNGFKTNGELSWAADKKLTGELNIEKTKATVTLTTPFDGYRSVKAETSYSARGLSGTLNGKIAWDGNKQIILQIIGDANQPDRLVTGKITLTTPFRGLESLTANLKYNVVGDKHTTNADFSWARGRQIAVGVTMTHQLNGWYLTNSGEVTVTTPFSGMRSGRIRWQHQNTADSWKCKHEAEVDGRKFSVDVDTSNRLVGNTRRISGRAIFQCPVLADWLQNASMSLDYQHDTRALKSLGKSEINYGRQKFTYEHDFNVDPSAAMVIKAKITTPFPAVQEIGFGLNNRRQGNGWTSNNELVMGSHGRIGLDGSYQLNGYAVDASITLTTPYRRLERISANLKNQQQRDGAWTAHTDLQYATNKQIVIDGKLGLQSAQKVAELEIKSPCPRLRQARVAAGYSGTARNFQASIELSHNALGRDKITAAVSANTADVQNMNVQLTARTPFADFSSFKVVGRHVRDTPEHTATNANWELNTYRGSALIDMKARDWVDFDGRYELEYTAGRKLELATSFKVDPKVVFTATFKSPFESARTVTATFNQEGPLDNFRMSAEVAHNRNNRYTSGLDFALRQDSLRTSFRLTTPHKSIERVATAFNVAGSPSKFNLDTSYELNGQKLTKTMSFEVASGPMLKISGKLDIPYGSIRSITYSVNHNGPATNFNNNLQINIDGATTKVTSEFRLNGPSIQFELTTPYQPLTLVRLAHTTKPGRTFAGWQNNAELQLNGNKYTGESSMGWKGNELQVSAIVKVPQEYSVSLTHKADSSTNFDTTVIFRMADKQIKETIGLKTSQALIDFKYNVETNYAGYERWDATFKHENSQVGFKSTVGLTTPLSQIPRVSAELTQRFTSKTDFTTTLKLQLPIQSASQIVSTLTHRGTAQDLTSTVSIKINEQTPMTGTLTFKNNQRVTEGSLAIQTPFAQLSTFNGQFRFAGQDQMNFIVTGNVEYTSNVLPAQATPTSVRLEHSATSRTQFKTIAELSIPVGKHSATLEHNGDPANFRSSLKIVTPEYTSPRARSTGTETYEATLEHAPQGDKPRTAITIRGPSRYQLTATKTGTLADLQLNGEILTPIKGFSRTAATYSHRLDWPTIVEIRGNVETAVTGWQRTSAALTHSGGNIKNFRTTASIETSQRGFERMTATATNAVDRTGAVKTSALIDTTIAGYTKFAASSDLSFKGRGGWRWVSSAETPLSGYERWSATMDHAPTSTGLRTSIQVTTPIANYRNFGAVLTHEGNSAAQFQTTVQLTTPCPVVPQIDVTLTHRGATYSDFATGLTVVYGSDKKIETSVSYKKTTSSGENSFEGSAKLATTDCSYFQDFIVTASHSRKPELKSGGLAMTVNGDKKVDFDYSYTTTGDRNININVRSPHSITTNMKVGGDGQGTAVVNWDKRLIQFDFGVKNTMTSSLTDRYVTLRVTVPSYRRTVGFGAGYSVGTERIASRGELYWDADAQPDFQYDIEASTKMTGRTLTGYDGRFKVVSSLFNTDSMFVHRISAGGRRQKTEIVLNAAEKLTIKSDLNMAASNGLTHVITIQHPKFSKDVTLTTEATPSGFKTTLMYEQQTWTLEGNLNDQSTANGPKYTSSLRLANPNSMFDIQLIGDYATVLSEKTTTGGIALKYFMSGDRQMKTLAALRAEINKLRKEISLSMETPIDTMRFTTTNRELDLESGIVRYDVNFECSHMYWRSVLDISRPERSFGIKVYTAPENFVEAFAQAMSPTQMTVELSHTTGSNRINDVQLSASYTDDEHLLIGRSYVRPDLPNDIRSYMDQAKSRMTTRRAQIKSAIDALATTMQNDGRMKSRSLQQAVVVPITKIAQYIAAEVSTKVDSVTAAYNAMYRDNEFYMRDIIQAMKRHYEDVSRKLAYKTADLRRKYAEWSESVSDQLDAIANDLARLNANTQRQAAAYWSGVADRWQQMKPDFEKIRPFIDNLIEKTKAKLMEFFDNLRESKSFRNFVDRLATMQPCKYIQPSHWQSKMEEIADKFDLWLQDLLSKPEVHYARDWLVRSMQNNNWLYKLLGLEQQVNEWIVQLRSMSIETMKAKLREYVNNYLQLEKTKWTAWDTQRGEYAFQVYIPFELPDISVLRRFDPRPLMQQTKAWIVRQLPDEDTSLIDIAYAYKLPSDIRDWVPPFKSHASLTGAQHYMTFDRRFFEFAGECSYLLARDFIGGTFSVVVNYDRAVNNKPIKKSLTIVTAGRQIEVYPDSKVTVDGSRVEMPVRVGNTTVLRRGNLISVMDDWRGLDITCDLPHDHCMLAVSGWYYGKTAGLFGTYDNEPSNDFTKSDTTLSTTPETIAESWTIGQRCRPINRAVIVQPDMTTRRYRACAELFTEARSSMFRSCFKVVDPSSYMTMCLNDAPAGDNSLEAETDVCRTAAAYVHECRRREVHLRMPKRCVRCEVPTTNKVFYELDQVTLDNENDIPRAADVVFVIQHAPCNRDVLEKMAGLSDGIEKAMKAEGITSTRFAVVGYGGKKSHLSGAHVHTMDGQIFTNTAKKLSLAIDNYDTEAATDADAMVALSYTARLPFRAGASKSVILISCDACREGTIRYSDIQRILLNNDIHLHVLVQETIRLKSKSPKTAYIYGTDQQTVYTRKDVAGDELAGEPDLRRYIRLPKDLCVALTMDTDGSVFSVRQWLDSRPLIQKQFVDVMVRTLARKAQPTECQICECLADEAQVGISQCRSCYRRDPFYWLPPNFDEDDSESESTKPSSPVAVPDNNSKVTNSQGIVTARPPPQVATRRPIAVRPTRRPITPPNRSRVTIRPAPNRAPARPRAPASRQQ